MQHEAMITINHILLFKLLLSQETFKLVLASDYLLLIFHLVINRKSQSLSLRMVFIPVFLTIVKKMCDQMCTIDGAPQGSIVHLNVSCCMY